MGCTKNLRMGRTTLEPLVLVLRKLRRGSGVPRRRIAPVSVKNRRQLERPNAKCAGLESQMFRSKTVSPDLTLFPRGSLIEPRSAPTQGRDAGPELGHKPMIRSTSYRAVNHREPQDAVASLFRNDAGPHDALRPRSAARFRRPGEDGKTSRRRRNVGARLLRFDGRLAAADDRTANGGRRASDESGPPDHRRHRRAKHRAGRRARPSRQGKRRERA